MMMGSETEFGILGGWTLEKASAIQKAVLGTQPYLAAAKEGVFLQNGGRAYIDQHRHNEFSTPEATRPDQLVIQELAGRALMAGCAATAGLSLLCSNLDPGTGVTWGAHENYECRQRLTWVQLARLDTHLVTRIVYTGGGGLDPDHPGVSLVLSPRASRIVTSYNRQGNYGRSLVFAKPEAYCAGDRLHVFCGESLLCHHASYLRFATTALVAHCLDAGWQVGPGPFAEPAVKLLRLVNRDIALTRPLPLQNGCRATALEIQEWLMEDVAAHLDALPPWAPEALQHWRAMLDRLREARPEVNGQVDWLVYRRALLQLADEYGYAPHDIRRLNRALHANPTPRLDGDDRERFRALRAAAGELYVRLHILGAESWFDRLATQAQLDHRLPGISDEAIAAAVLQPPPGRAGNRAVLICRYHGQDNLRMSWDRLTDADQRRVHDVPEDPAWTGEEQWRLPAPEPQVLNEFAEAYFWAGHYHAAIGYLESVDLRRAGPPAEHAFENLCLSYARLGMKTEAQAALASVGEFHAGRFEQVAVSLFCAVNYGLSPPLEHVVPLMHEGERLLAAPGADGQADESHLFVFQQNRALVLGLLGQLQAAERACRQLLASLARLERPRMTARTRCFLGNILRLQGRTEEALHEVTAAVDTHVRKQLLADLACHSLPLLAMLSDDTRARDAITDAESFQRELDNPLGLMRVLCVKARRLGTPADFAEVSELRARSSALQECPVAERIVHDWNAWVHGQPGSAPDDYWGL